MSKILSIAGRYYDFETKNTSFLQTAQELKTLGIKNWYWMLEVRYPQLGVQDIDPHDPDISQEDIGKLIIECKANPLFFFREVAIVPVRGIGKRPPILHRASAALIWCFLNSIDVILCQPRQTYKSTWATLVVEYMFLFEYQNCDIPYLHIKETRCVDNAEMLRDYIEALPKYLNPWSSQKHPPGAKSLKYTEHGTSIAIVSVADSESKAKDKLRGYTLFGANMDEWEYIPYNGNVLAGGAPAMISAKENARKLGIRTCIMLTSTPGDLETSDGKSAQRVIDQTPPFSEQMYDLSKSDIKSMFNGMNTEEGGVQVPITRLYIEFNWKQLRKTEEWLREQYQLAVDSGDISEYRRGILLERYRGSDTAIFRQEDIDYLIAHVKNPDYEIMLLNKYILYVYKHEVHEMDLNSPYPYFDISIPYLIGMDIAGGMGGNADNTVLLIVHPYTLQVVGEVVSPYLGCSLDLMRVIATIAKMLPRAIFCPETNSVGKALLEWVQDSELEYRFYHDPQLDITKNALVKTVDMSVKMKHKAQMKKYIGTNVTAKVRNDMMGLLKRYVHDYRHLITSRSLVKDITNLTILNGKIQADRGEHDDVVMAYCHVLYVLTYGYDLTRFGIDKRLCTYEKAFDIAQDYGESLKEDIVNNIVPYENPDAYENQLLRDILDYDERMGFNNPGGVDPYGYKKSQYDTKYLPDPKPELQHISNQDIAFFNELNSFL